MPRKSSGVEKISIARDTQDNGDILVPVGVPEKCFSLKVE